MKFLASKKLSDNAPLRLVMIWMLISLLLAIGLNLSIKAIDLGTSPQEWCSAILGDEEQFIDPMGFEEILLSLHTELFGLILLFILIASMAVRLNLATQTKIISFALCVISLLLYPILLLSTPLIGEAGVIGSIAAFLLFNTLMALLGGQTLVALILKKL